MVPVSKKILKFVALHQLAMGKDVTVQGRNNLLKSQKNKKLRTDDGNSQSLLQMFNHQTKPRFFTSANGDLYIESDKYYQNDEDSRQIIKDTLRSNNMIYLTNNGYIVEQVSPSTRSTNPPPHAYDPAGNFFIDENKFNEVTAVSGLDGSGVKQAMVDVLRGTNPNAKVIVTRTQPGYPNPVVSMIREITDVTQLNIDVPQPIIDPTPAPVTDEFNAEQYIDNAGNVHIPIKVFEEKIMNFQFINLIFEYMRLRHNQGRPVWVLLAAHSYGTLEKYNWRMSNGTFSGYNSDVQDFQDTLKTLEEFDQLVVNLRKHKNVVIRPSQ